MKNRGDNSADQRRPGAIYLFIYSSFIYFIIISPPKISPLPWTDFSFGEGKMGCLGNKTEDQRNEEKAQREANKKIEKQLQKDKQIYRATHRLLLLGKFLTDCCLAVYMLPSWFYIPLCQCSGARWCGIYISVEIFSHVCLFIQKHAFSIIYGCI